MKIGYARVSTYDQNLDMQIDALKKSGCAQIFTDVLSGVKSEREGLKKALEYAREEDTIVVWKLDRLGRSIQHLIETIKSLEERKISFESLQESINTSTSTGKLMFHIFSALAEFERDIILERTNAGLRSARARGRFGGRPPMLNQNQIKRMIEIYNDQKTRASEICRMYNISKVTMYKYIKEYSVKLPQPIIVEGGLQRIDNV